MPPRSRFYPSPPRLLARLDEVPPPTGYPTVTWTPDEDFCARQRHRPDYSPDLRFAILGFKNRFRLSTHEICWAFAIHKNTLRTWDSFVDGDHAPTARPGMANTRATPLVDAVPAITNEVHAIADAAASLPAIAADHAARITRGLTALCKQIPVRVRYGRLSVHGLRSKSSATSTRRHARKHIVARRPNHVWMIDITEFAAFLKGVLPFKIAIVLDVYSRDVLAWQLFLKEPTDDNIVALFESAIAHHGSPKHLISDQGAQFTAPAFKEMLAKHGIKPREGAIGEHGSIAFIERCIRTIKEALHLEHDPTTLKNDILRRAEAAFLWYSHFRPHQTLSYATPHEVYYGLPPASANAKPAPRGVSGDTTVRLNYTIAYTLHAQERLPYFARIE